MEEMDIGDVGYGAGGGLISAVLVALGFKSRMDKQDERMNKQDARMDKQDNTVMYKDTCDAVQKGMSVQLDTLNINVKTVEKLLMELLTRRREDREIK